MGRVAPLTPCCPITLQALFQNEEVSIIAVIDCPKSALLGKANSKLPDCVPLEIKSEYLDSVAIKNIYIYIYCSGTILHSRNYVGAKGGASFSQAIALLNRKMCFAAILWHL